MNMDINEQIENKKSNLFSGEHDSTYYTRDLFKFVVNNITDPDVLFKIKIYGYYKRKYKWTKEQADKFIKDNLEDSRGYYVNGTWYAYDWGSGENSVTNDKMHKPHLDHKDVRSKGGSDDPENMRILSARQNENKGDTDNDQERWATIVTMWNDIEDKEKYADLLKSLPTISKHH